MLLTRGTEFVQRLGGLVLRGTQAGSARPGRSDRYACSLSLPGLRVFIPTARLHLRSGKPHPSEEVSYGYARRQAFQSSRVAFSMPFAALCSHRSLRRAKSRRTAGMDLRLPRWILAVSQPM